eukprot:696893-Amphidinium_carterae.1
MEAATRLCVNCSKRCNALARRNVRSNIAAVYDVSAVSVLHGSEDINAQEKQQPIQKHRAREQT